MKRLQDCELFYKMKLWDELQNKEVVGKQSVKKKTPLLESFFSKVTGLRSESLLKKESNTGVFTSIWWNFLRKPPLKNISGGCFCTKGLFLLLFCNEKCFKQIFFQLSASTCLIISFYTTK